VGKLVLRMSMQPPKHVGDLEKSVQMMAEMSPDHLGIILDCWSRKQTIEYLEAHEPERGADIKQRMAQHKC